MKGLVSLYEKVLLSPDLMLLYLNRVIIQIALGFIGAFGVIFFYEQFSNSIEKVIMLYAALYLVFTVTAHPGSKLIQKIGMKRMMVLSTIFLVISIVARLMWDTNVFLFLLLFFFCAVVKKMLYWIPYHIEFAAFTKSKMRGKQLAVMTNSSEILLALLPLLSGYILMNTGYNTLFVIAIAISMLSVIPLLFLRETKEIYSWSLRELVREFLLKKNRPLVTSHVANGFQDGVATVIWPIFVFMLLSNNYFYVGLISTLVILVIIVLRFIIGEMIDRVGTKKILKYGAFLSSGSWILKVFVESGLGVFVADAFQGVGRLVNRMPFDVSTYDQAADSGHFIDEYTVLKESSFLLGKFTILALSLFIISIFSIKVTFIIAAVAVFGMGLISNRIQIGKQ